MADSREHTAGFYDAHIATGWTSRGAPGLPAARQWGRADSNHEDLSPLVRWAANRPHTLLLLTVRSQQQVGSGGFEPEPDVLTSVARDWQGSTATHARICGSRIARHTISGFGRIRTTDLGLVKAAS